MSARAAQGGKDISMRPPWVQPCKSAPHPWRPLQWDHVSQIQLRAFESGLRGSNNCVQASSSKQPQQSCSNACQGQQPLAAQARPHAKRQIQRQPMGPRQLAPEMPHAIAAIGNHTGRQVQMQQVQQQLSVSPADRHVSSGKSVSWLGQQAGCLKRSYASQAGVRHPDCPPMHGSCQHTSAGDAPDRPASAVHMASRSSMRQSSAGGKGRSCRAGLDTSSPGNGSQGLSTTGAHKPSKAVSSARHRSVRQAVTHQAEVKSEDVSTAQHSDGRSRVQAASRGQNVLPTCSASASPTVMGNWIRWEATEHVDEVGCSQACPPARFFCSTVRMPCFSSAVSLPAVSPHALPIHSHVGVLSPALLLAP